MLITSEYNVQLSPELLKLAGTDSVRHFFVSYLGMGIRLPDRWHPDPALLRRHHSLINEDHGISSKKP